MTPDTTVRVPGALVEALVAAADAAAPREACGLLFGEGNQIDSHAAADNVADDPKRRFEIDPAALFAALKAERAGGAKLVGYWHAHPSGDATPSATDVAMAAGDGRIWLIVAGDSVTAWRSLPGGFAPLALDQSPAGPR